MSIVNRRNATLGWLTWLTAKRVAKKKARAIVPGTASFAFFFRMRFAVSQVTQPSMALRLFTMLMRPG